VATIPIRSTAVEIENDARLDAIEALLGLGGTVDRGDIVITSAGTTWSFDSGVVTAFARTILDDTNAAGVRTTIGLGSLATLSTVDNGNWSGTALSIANGGTGATSASAARTALGLGTIATLSSINGGNWSGTDLAVVDGGTGASSASGARANLGVVPGTDVQAFSSMLAAYASAAWTSGVLVPTLTAANTIALKTVGSAAGNLLDKSAGDALYQPLNSKLTALASGATWTAGTQLPAFTAAGTVTMKTVGSASGNILDKAAGDTLYAPASVSASVTSVTASLAAALNRIAVLEGTAKTTLPVLTTSGASYHAVHSIDLLVPTYGGSAFQVIRNSDSATVNLGFTGARVAPGDVAALRGSGSALRIAKWYDQLGNSSRDMTQTTSGKRPALHENATIAGSPVILIDGTRQYNNAGGSTPRGLDFTDSLTGQAVTIFLVVDQNSSIQQQLVMKYENGTTGVRSLYHNSPLINVSPGNNAMAFIGYYQGTTGGSVGFLNKQYRSQPQVLCITEFSSGPVELMIDGVKSSAKTVTALSVDASAPGADSLTTGHIGYSADTSEDDFYSNMRVLARVAVSGSLNDVDKAGITDALMGHFGIPKVFTSRHVLIGDSIAEGSPDTADLTLAASWYLRQQTLTGLPELYNLGIGGKTVAAMYADRTYYDAPLYVSGIPVVYEIEGGINDLRTGTSAASLYSTVSTYVTYLKALGSNVRVIVDTLLKSSLNDSTQAQRVVDYNVLVRANTAGAHVINDQAAESHFAAAGSESDTTLLRDGIHPTNLGYSYLMPVRAAAINSALAL
jgi:hypothetical protein